MPVERGCRSGLRTWVHRGSALIVFFVVVGVVVSAAPPVAVDDAVILDEDTTVLIPVLGNDSDPDLDPLHIASVSDPACGTTVIEGDQIRYTPDPNYCGMDTFSYTVSDGGETDTADVELSITCINDAPIAVDDRRVTPSGVSVGIFLRAVDPDIDPFNPDSEPLLIHIVDGPAHGTISGNLSGIRTESPHNAVLELIYTPGEGFAGVDYVTFSVTDPLSAFDMAVVEIEVQESPPILGVMAGNTSAEVIFESPFTLDYLGVAFTGYYKFGNFNAQASLDLNTGGYSTVVLGGDYPFWDVLRARANAVFDLDAVGFQYLQAVTTFQLASLNCSFTTYLTGNEATTYNKLVVQGSIGNGLSFTSTTCFSGCGLTFDQQEFKGRWTMCDIEVRTELDITQAGFEMFSFELRDIPILRPPGLDMGIYLRLETTFELESKIVEPMFILQSDWLDCVRVLGEVIMGVGMTIEGVSLYGIQIRNTFAGEIEFRADTSLDDTKNAALTGYSEYFEDVILSGPMPSCCGPPGLWQFATYFQRGSSEIFDWGMTAILFDMAINNQIRFSTGLSVSATAPHLELSCGFKVRW